jgi:hypothetical protein
MFIMTEVVAAKVPMLSVKFPFHYLQEQRMHAKLEVADSVT